MSLGVDIRIGTVHCKVYALTSIKIVSPASTSKRCLCLLTGQDADCFLVSVD